MVLQFSLQCIQFLIDFRHSFFHWREFCSTNIFSHTCQYSPALRTNLRNLLWSTDTGYHIFTLCVDQVFTVEKVFTCTGITRETNTRCRSVTHITEYHSLYVYSCSPFIGYTFHLTIKDSTFVHPWIKYGTDSSPKLFVSTSREIFSGLFFHSGLELLHKFLQVCYFQFVIKLYSFWFFYFFNDCFERIDIFLVRRLHAQNNVTVHLYKTTIRVPCKTGITSLADDTFHHLVIQTQIQNSIHHTRHRRTGTWTYRNQQWIFDITEFRFHQFFYTGNGLYYFIFQQLNHFITSQRIILRANFCSYCESGRNGNSN